MKTKRILAGIVCLAPVVALAWEPLTQLTIPKAALTIAAVACAGVWWWLAVYALTGVSSLSDPFGALKSKHAGATKTCPDCEAPAPSWAAECDSCGCVWG